VAGFGVRSAQAPAIPALMRVPALAVLLLLAPTTMLAGNNNADACDIGVTPAATLLLPYFEVDVYAAPGAGTNTLFTVTNTSRYPQIAHVTLWTDWAFPVFNFNLFLTGYDVQGVNLYDVLVNGVIPTDQRFDDAVNPNFVPLGDRSAGSTCAAMPRSIPPDLLLAVRNALAVGAGYDTDTVKCSTSRYVGFNHGTIAKGYVTVDVVSYCTEQMPTDSGYYSGARGALLYDNVLLGDYEQVGPTPAGSGTASTFDATGNPMVHIRAIPEGGLSGAGGGGTVTTNLPFTFYDRYTLDNYRTADRRQPLPSTWVARYIQGGAIGYATDFKIWSEGVTTGQPRCLSGFGFTSRDAANNSAINVASIVRFDEHDNGYVFGQFFCILCGPPALTLPASSRISTTQQIFPPLTGVDVGGWMYMNLSSDATATANELCDGKLSAQRTGFGTNDCGARKTTQNWVTVSMYGALGKNRLSAEFDGAWLGNGCTPALPVPPWPRNKMADRPLVCPANTSPYNCGDGTRPPQPNP
jgi:hypothetical protein